MEIVIPTFFSCFHTSKETKFEALKIRSGNGLLMKRK